MEYEERIEIERIYKMNEEEKKKHKKGEKAHNRTA